MGDSARKGIVSPRSAPLSAPSTSAAARASRQPSPVEDAAAGTQRIKASTGSPLSTNAPPTAPTTAPPRPYLALPAREGNRGNVNEMTLSPVSPLLAPRALRQPSPVVTTTASNPRPNAIGAPPRGASVSPTGLASARKGPKPTLSASDEKRGLVKEAILSPTSPFSPSQTSRQAPVVGAPTAGVQDANSASAPPLGTNVSPTTLVTARKRPECRVLSSEGVREAALSPAVTSAAPLASKQMSPVVADTKGFQRTDAAEALTPAFSPEGPATGRTRLQPGPLASRDISPRTFPLLHLMSPSGAGGQIPLSPAALDLSWYSPPKNEPVGLHSTTPDYYARKGARRLSQGIFPGDQEGNPRYYVYLATCAVGLCILLLLVDSVSSAYFDYCDNPVSCFDLDTELQRSRLVDVDPCQNMFGHVCGRWESMYPGQLDQFELLNNRLRMNLLENSGRVRIGSGSAVDKAGAALSACLRVEDGYVDDISTIHEVLNHHGLSFPAQEIRSSRDLFRILVSLTLQDLLGVFFQLKPSPYLRTGHRFVLELKYAETMYRYIANETAMAACIRSYDLEIEDVESLALALVNVESDVIVMNKIFQSGSPKKQYLKFQDIEQAFYESVGLEPTIKTEWWTEDINENIPKKAAVSTDSEILVGDMDAIFLTEALLRGYKTRSLPLQNYIAWKVIKYLSYGASSKMVHCHNSLGLGHRALAFAAALARCITYTKVVLPYGILNLELRNILDDRTMNYVTNVSKNIREQMELSYNSSLGDSLSAKVVVERLRSIHQIIGTSSKLRSDGALNAYYKHVPKYDAHTKFVVWLLEAHRAVAAHKKQFLRPSPEVAASISRDDWEATEIFVGAFYITLYNLIYVPGSIMLPPLLLPRGPDSYNYGGIGKVIGHELSHAFEPKYLEGQAAYTPILRRLLAEQEDCLILQANKMTHSAIAGNNSISETFADNAGVEIAYLAYSTLRQSDIQKGTGQYTADQAFFAASCYIFCEAKRSSSQAGAYLPHSLRCNQPCINTQEFADAFHCTEGSPMFPLRRCDIHDRNRTKYSENL